MEVRLGFNEPFFFSSHFFSLPPQKFTLSIPKINYTLQFVFLSNLAFILFITICFAFNTFKSLIFCLNLILRHFNSYNLFIQFDSYFFDFFFAFYLFFFQFHPSSFYFILYFGPYQFDYYFVIFFFPSIFIYFYFLFNFSSYSFYLLFF